MVAPIEIAVRTVSGSALSSPTSSVSSSPVGRYIPVHRRNGSSSSISSFSSQTSSVGKVPIYSRDDLLRLASSPLSHIPLSETLALAKNFPSIVRPEGGEIDRALKMSSQVPNTHRYHRRRSGSHSHGNNLNQSGGGENNGTKRRGRGRQTKNAKGPETTSFFTASRSSKWGSSSDSGRGSVSSRSGSSDRERW